MAWAAAKFTDALLRAMGGESGVIIPTFVQSDLFADRNCDFFASKVELSKDGVGKVHGLGELADWEKELLEACLKDLAANIKKVGFPCTPVLQFFSMCSLRTGFLSSGGLIRFVGLRLC
jgi:malate/lactate dehydrogenase